MLNRAEDALFLKVSRQREQIIAATLDLNVLPLSDIIRTHLQLRAAWHSARDLFTDKEVGVAPQAFGTVYGVVVGNCNQVHSPALQLFVSGFRRAIRFPAKSSHERQSAHAGVEGVNVEVTAHDLG